MSCCAQWCPNRHAASPSQKVMLSKFPFLLKQMWLIFACVVYQSKNSVSNFWCYFRRYFQDPHRRMKHVVSMIIRACWSLCVSNDNIMIALKSERRKMNVSSITGRHNYSTPIVFCRRTDSESLLWLSLVVFRSTIWKTIPWLFSDAVYSNVVAPNHHASKLSRLAWNRSFKHLQDRPRQNH